MQTTTLHASPKDDQADDLLSHYQQIRQDSEAICAPLEIEDYGIQTMADVSPPKWHLTHTSWFFETFLLTPYLPDYSVFHPDFVRLFNSYYEQVGAFHPRPQRGLLSRPTVADVYRYRKHVDDAMQCLLAQQAFWFECDESIHTECSYKYTIEEFARLADRAGLQLQQAWVDDNNLFSLQFYKACDRQTRITRSWRYRILLRYRHVVHVPT